MFSHDDAKLSRALERRRFTPHFVGNSAEAKADALALIGKDSAGFGGSVTVSSMGIYEELLSRGNAVFSHSHAPKEEKDAVRIKASHADWFLASTNAITEDGLLVNIDGTGNRVASMIIGPKNVLLIIGKNKLVPTVEAGIERIKRETCPKNARRLGLSTLPCGISGKCADCQTNERMCNVTTIMERVPRLIESFHLILVDEEIGW